MKMKTILIALFPALLIGMQPKQEAYSTPTSVADDDLKPTITQEKVQTYVTRIFSGYHYRKFTLNDSLSSKMYDNYLDEIDRGKLYFLANDIQAFEKYRNTLDESLQNGNLTAAYDIYNTFRKRYRERSTYIDKLLAEPKFDFTVDESFNIDREKSAWAKTPEELNEVWRKLIKNEALELKLTGKADTSVVKILKDRYKNRERNLGRLRSEQVFQMYMNAFCEVLDPHTHYFSPTDSDRFKQDMYKALEGIGAQLREDGNYIKVVEVIVGGPAYKDKRLKKDDRIIGVAQGDEGKFEDIVGWYIDDAVKKIKGSKGTVVRLQVLAANAMPTDPPKEIRLVREKVNLQESRAKKEVITITQDKQTYKVGVIHIPSFYRNFDEANKGGKDFASTTRDVHQILDSLKTENVAGVVIDLRNNGGGSLVEAITLTGLFIAKGPVVQVKEARGDTEVQTDPDPSIAYNGPLAVLVNRFSASASEIFAGAIQDYKRGVIVGEQTYGKGTVQTMVDLNQWLKDSDKLGQINITVAKFYRVNGSSTQRKGVVPDIELPTAFTAAEHGESSQPTALPWDQIATSNYEATKFINDKLLAKLRDKYQHRLKTEQDLKTLVEELDLYRKAKENTVVSLQETKRKKEREEAQKKQEALKKMNSDLEDGDGEEEANTPKTVSAKKRKDIYLDETSRVLIDMVGLAKTPNLANR